MLNEFEDSIGTSTRLGEIKSSELRPNTSHIFPSPTRDILELNLYVHPLHFASIIDTTRLRCCGFTRPAPSFDVLSVLLRMRLTIPRWASAVSKATGKPGAAVVERLQSLQKHDRKRRDVINPDLCDEALDLLRPLLPPPSTCDIIDVSPGVGIWSQRLHQVLKPRRHVFVETEYDNYEENLAPLLAQPQSAYRLAPTISDALDEKQDFLSSGLRESYTSLDSEAREAASQSSTSQLIITANLAQKSVKSNGFQGAMSKLFLEHFYRNTIMGTGAFPWHKYGLVRLLAWIPEVDKSSFIPRCTSYRYRSAKQLEACCHITEIISSFPHDNKVSQMRPWFGAEMESVREVAARQSASNVVIPAYRQQPPPKPPSAFLTPVEQNFPLLKSIGDRPRLVDEYIAAYNDMKASDPEWLEGYMDRPHRTRWDNHIKDQSDPRIKFSKLRIRMKTAHANYGKVDDLVCAQIEIERRLIAFRRNDPGDVTGYLELLNSLLPTLDRLKSRQAALFKDSRHAAKKAVDDYRALNHTPHLLCWHNRPFEPLLCHPKQDFFPQYAMSLLDITPRAEFVQKVNTADLQIVFDYLCHNLEFSRMRSVKEALEILVGGSEACERFVGTFGEPGGIPSLTDPLYGGSHDLDDFRLRTMNTQQLVDITLAYNRWPFRMSLNEMIEAMSPFGSAKMVK